jgi:hypothetical protein
MRYSRHGRNLGLSALLTRVIAVPSVSLALYARYSAPLGPRGLRLCSAYSALV